VCIFFGHFLYNFDKSYWNSTRYLYLQIQFITKLEKWEFRWQKSMFLNKVQFFWYLKSCKILFLTRRISTFKLSKVGKVSLIKGFRNQNHEGLFQHRHIYWFQLMWSLQILSILEPLHSFLPFITIFSISRPRLRHSIFVPKSTFCPKSAFSSS